MSSGKSEGLLLLSLYIDTCHVCMCMCVNANENTRTPDPDSSQCWWPDGTRSALTNLRETENNQSPNQKYNCSIANLLRQQGLCQGCCSCSWQFVDIFLRENRPQSIWDVQLSLERFYLKANRDAFRNRKLICYLNGENRKRKKKNQKISQRHKNTAFSLSWESNPRGEITT